MAADRRSKALERLAMAFNATQDRAAAGRELAKLVHRMKNEALEDSITGCMSVDTHQLYESDALAREVLGMKGGA